MADEKEYRCDCGPIIEFLAALEHEQWMHWSKKTLENLKSMDGDEPDAFTNAVYFFEAKWRPNWIPYSELPEEIKEHDRKWTRKVMELISKEIKAERERIFGLVCEAWHCKISGNSEIYCEKYVPEGQWCNACIFKLKLKKELETEGK